MRTKNSKAISRAEREHLGRAKGWHERRRRKSALMPAEWAQINGRLV